MENENENLDSLNEETGQEEDLETTPPEETDDVDALKEQNRQLFARAKKAETALKEVKKEKPAEVKKPIVVQPVNDDVILQKIDERFEKRELDALEMSDDLKQEVQAYAKLNKVSIRKAVDSDYIQFKKEKADQQAKVEDASLGGGKRAHSSKDYSQMQANDFNLKTKEGKEEFKKWEEWVKASLG